MGHFKAYGFLYGLFLLILLAFFQVHSDAVLLSFNDSFKWLAIALIFAFQGLSIEQQSLFNTFESKGELLFALIWNFVFIPILVLLLLVPFVSEWIGTGFFLLAIVPTTIALSVAYTDLSKGRVELALMATLISNLLGTVLVPLFFLLFIGEGIQDSHSAFGQMLKKLFLILVLPLFLGVFIRRLLPKCTQSLLKVKKIAVECLLLGILYNSFLKCFSSDLASANSVYWIDFALVGILSLLLWASVSVMVWWSSACCKFDKSSRIALFFVSSQKSMCSGLPLILLSLALFPNNYNEGHLLLPLIFYYLFQTVFGSFFIHSFTRTRSPEIN